MKQEIYVRHYAQVLVDEESHYFVRYDYGSIATQIREIPITQEEAEQIMKMENWKEFGQFLRTTCHERWQNATPVTPSEHVGDTIKLIMG